jgi:hypothetical protein
MTLSQAEYLIKKNFDIEPEVKYKQNIMFIRVNGLDNVSLANYIIDKLDNLKVTVQEREGYKFSNLGWIQIEKCEGKSHLVYTNCKNIIFY